MQLPKYQHYWFVHMFYAALLKSNSYSIRKLYEHICYYQPYHTLYGHFSLQPIPEPYSHFVPNVCYLPLKH